MLMMRARVQGHRWVDHPAAAVMEARVPGQWVDRPAAMVMEAREQGRCWIDHPAAAVMEARVQGRHWVDRPSITYPCYHCQLKFCTKKEIRSHYHAIHFHAIYNPEQPSLLKIHSVKLTAFVEEGLDKVVHPSRDAKGSHFVQEFGVPD
ncbi:hypothetical protein ACOMHN_013230 [Nucella lapillus]